MVHCQKKKKSKKRKKNAIYFVGGERQTARGSYNGRDMPIILGFSVNYVHAGDNACLQDIYDKSRKTRLIPNARDKYMYGNPICVV